MSTISGACIFLCISMTLGLRDTFGDMALLKNPYKLNSSATTTADQLESTRALAWELQQLWLGLYGAPPMSFVLKDFFADPTRKHVAWAARCRGGPPACNSLVRAQMAQLDLMARALLLEPVVIKTTNADDLPRMALLRGMSDSRNIISWGADRNLLIQSLSKAIRTDPAPLVRLEALRAVGLAPIPAEWVPTLIDAIQRAEAVLAQTPFNQATRQALAKYMADVTGKLQSSLVQMPTGQLPTGQPSIEPMTSGVVDLPTPESYLRRTPLLLGILAASALSGVAIALIRNASEEKAQSSLSGRPPKSKTRHPKNKTEYATLDRIAADPRVEYIHDEGPDGIWISLVPGYNWEGASSVHEWNLKDLLAAFRSVEEGGPY